MNHHMTALEDSGLITDCKCSCGSLLLFAAKPYQEDCSNINVFIWRLCVSCIPLNSTTCSFEYPIYRCTDSIEDFGDSYGSLSTISLDARSWYHHVNVRPWDQDKLDFSTQYGKNKHFKIMPFGPKNAPAFYTTIWKLCVRNGWSCFVETKNSISIVNSSATIICDNKIIMDDVLLFSNHDPTFLYYFSCIFQVFTKYMSSFKFSKCDFLSYG